MPEGRRRKSREVYTDEATLIPLSTSEPRTELQHSVSPSQELAPPKLDLL